MNNQSKNVLGPGDTRSMGRAQPSQFTIELRKIISQRMAIPREGLENGLDSDGQSLLSALSVDLNFDEYSFEDDKPHVLDPRGKDQEVVLDVAALDRYNEDVRYYRNLILQECRRFPKKGPISDRQLQAIASGVARVCRIAYYGTHKSRLLAGELIPLLVWMLNETELPGGLHSIILRSIGELLYDSVELKKQFVKQSGIKVLCRWMRNLPDSPNLSQIAAYVLTMAAIGCADVILETREQKDIEELIGEMTFECYWTDWPVNFGIILQGVIFGPNSISPNIEIYQNL